MMRMIIAASELTGHPLMVCVAVQAELTTTLSQLTKLLADVESRAPKGVRCICVPEPAIYVCVCARWMENKWPLH